MAADAPPPGSFPNSSFPPPPGGADPASGAWMPPLPPQAATGEGWGAPAQQAGPPPAIPVSSGIGAGTAAAGISTATAPPPVDAAVPPPARAPKPAKAAKEPADRSKLVVGAVIAVAVVVILGVVALVAAPNIVATMVAGDRNRFQKSADVFTESLNSWQSQIEKLSMSEWSTAKSVGATDLERMKSSQSQMASSATKLSGKPREIANVMVESSGKIVRDADDIVAAMTDGRPNDIKRAGEALKADSDAYNAAVKDWNALG